MKQKQKFQWAPLTARAITRKGDRAIYADKSLGFPLLPDELGMRVDQTGYHGVARRKLRPSCRD